MKLQWKTCFKVGVSIFILYLCITYWSGVAGFVMTLFSAAVPLVIGFVIAYLVNILMTAYEQRYFPRTRKIWLIKSRRPVCMVGAFVTLVAVVALVVYLVVPELVSCVQLLLAEVPGAMETLIEKLDAKELIPENILDTLASVDWKSRLEQMLSVLTAGVGSALGTVIGVVSSVFSGLVTGFLALIFAVYLLTGKEKLCAQSDLLMKRYVRKTWYDRLKHILAIADDCFHRYIVGQCLEAVILGVLCTLGMWLLGLPYATMIGALIAFTALIPVAGAYIGAGVGAFMILTVSPVKALIFLAFILILQQLEGNLIYPRVVGSSMGLPAIWVLAAVTVGGGVMGIGGMLLGVPIAAAVYRLLREDVYRVPVEMPDTTGKEVSESADGPGDQG